MSASTKHSAFRCTRTLFYVCLTPISARYHLPYFSTLRLVVEYLKYEVDQLELRQRKVSAYRSRALLCAACDKKSAAHLLLVGFHAL